MGRAIPTAPLSAPACSLNKCNKCPRRYHHLASRPPSSLHPPTDTVHRKSVLAARHSWPPPSPTCSPTRAIDSNRETPTTGFPYTSAQAFTVVSPTRTPVNDPGPVDTANSSTDSIVAAASLNASSATPKQPSRVVCRAPMEAHGHVPAVPSHRNAPSTLRSIQGQGDHRHTSSNRFNRASILFISIATTTVLRRKTPKSNLFGHIPSPQPRRERRDQSNYSANLKRPLPIFLIPQHIS